MYAWIWRRLPFGLPGKITGSLLLAGSAMALLWFVIFPWADPWIEETLLPWNEGQLEGDFTPGGDPAGPAGPADPGDPALDPDDDPGLTGPDGEVLEDEHDIPYDTDG